MIQPFYLPFCFAYNHMCLQSEKADDYSIRTIPHTQSVDIKKYYIVDFSKLTHLTEKTTTARKETTINTHTFQN